MQNEIWGDIPNYKGMYQASSLGNIKSIKRNRLGKCGSTVTVDERLLKLTLNRYGYFQVQLCNNNNKTNYVVHKLVAMAFLNHTPSGMDLVVNHKNFIRTDNRLDNLEIINQRENSNLKHIKHTSVYTGVCWNKKDKKWLASMSIKKKKYYLGSFDNKKRCSFGL